MKNQPASVRTSLTGPLSLGAATLLLLFISLSGWYRDYRIFGDDLPVLGASAGNPKQWFVSGFSTYFRVYPEWSSFNSNFCRPVVNGILWLEQSLFGDHFAFYFLFYFVAQFLIVAVVLSIAREFGAQKKWLFVVSVLLALESAFVGQGLVNISYQFDVYCGLFALASLLFLVRQQYAIAVLLLTLAVFTKESALFAPLAAAIAVFSATRRKLLTLLMLLPMGAWLAVREFVLVRHGIGNTYVFPSFSLKGIGFVLVRGILFWPLGSLAADALIVFPIVANIAFWIFLIVVSYRSLSSVRQQQMSMFSLCVWLLGALSIGVLVAQNARFGGSIYPLELLLLAVIISKGWPSSGFRLFSGLILSALAIAIGVNFWNFFAIIPPSQMEKESLQRELTAMRIYGQNAHAIYILNATANYAAPEYLAATAGVPAHVVVLNQFEGCLNDPSGETSIRENANSSLVINARIPRCARFVFRSLEETGFDPPVGGYIERGDFARYSFAEEKPAWHHPFEQKSTMPNLGHQISIDLKIPPQNSILLYYDWRIGKYRCFGEPCSRSSAGSQGRDPVI